MRFVNNKSEYYHIIEELKCPFINEADYIILKDNEIIYWQSKLDSKMNIKMVKSNIEYVESIQWRSETRKEKTLNYLRETLNKMISYERELKIDKVLKDDNEYKYWLC